jgi:hypothetical protein
VTVAACIGCGAREVLRDCTGDCSEKKLELVRGVDCEHVLARAARARRSAHVLEEVALRLAGTESGPAAYRELQGVARDALRRAGAPADVGDEPAERIMTWWCPGCGRIEAPQPCIGVCIRRPDEMVSAARYDDARARATAAGRAERLLAELARMVTCVTPRDGQWNRNWRALHARGRTALAALADADASDGT